MWDTMLLRQEVPHGQGHLEPDLPLRLSRHGYRVVLSGLFKCGEQGIAPVGQCDPAGGFPIRPIVPFEPGGQSGVGDQEHCPVVDLTSVPIFGFRLVPIGTVDLECAVCANLNRRRYGFRSALAGHQAQT